MPGRSYNSAEYRYGFNGQEKDDEVYGGGNSTTAEFWQYDTRLGRRWNVDPMAHERFEWSPYNAMRCNPIYNVDATGALDGWYNDANGNTTYDANINSQADLDAAGISGSYVGQTFSGTMANGYGVSGDAQGNLNVSLPAVEVTASKTTPAAPAPTSSIAMSNPEIPTLSKTATPWMDYAFKEKGQSEWSTGNNPKIVEYLNTAGNKSKSDETAWCASFASWCMSKSNIPFAGPVGNSWSTWGRGLSKPAYGSVAVFKTGHVGFVAGETSSGKLVMLHGNWSNRVDLSTYGIDKAQIKLYRYPESFTPSYTLPKYK